MDNLNDEANERYTKAIFDYLHKKLGVEGDRGYVSVTYLSSYLPKADCFIQDVH